MENNESPKAPKRVGAVTQAFRIMRCLSDSDGHLGVSAIARKATVNQSTAFNILRTLVAEKAVDFDEPSKTYSLSKGLLELCEKLIGNSIVADIRGELERVADETNCLTGLWQANEGKMILIARAVSKRPMRLDMDIKHRLPPYAGSIGRAYAASQGLSDQSIKEAFKTLHWEGNIDEDRYLAEIRQAERDGFAIDKEGLYPGVVTVSSLIFDRHGQVLYGITASDIAYNLSEVKINELGIEIRTICRAMTQLIQ
tara:strand:- start:731 stop:1495 length:765 start_codon:yes stop_codon:yes gene_type:complete